MTIPPGLLQAFHDTYFNVEGLGTIRIGQPLPALLRAWMERGSVTQISILGAENPQAVLTSDAENEERHASLLQECRARGYTIVHVLGQANTWQERHVLVTDISRDTAEEFRRRYHQVAVIHATISGTAQLVMDDR
ncbi:MAG: DUF3293 domain-containing protein [Candidatus Kapabacteria bacterium]|nr:DUF3293 domain-containing protein [Candidatus Kapabacteria bacterium]